MSKIKKYIIITLSIFATIAFMIINRKSTNTDVSDSIGRYGHKIKEESSESLLDASESESNAMIVSKDIIKENKNKNNMEDSEFLKDINNDR